MITDLGELICFAFFCMKLKACTKLKCKWDKILVLNLTKWFESDFLANIS